MALIAVGALRRSRISRMRYLFDYFIVAVRAAFRLVLVAFSLPVIHIAILAGSLLFAFQFDPTSDCSIDVSD